MKTYDDKELCRRVDEVLFYIWDPIGVAECPSARGEYESYVSQIHELLQNHDGIEEISYLLEHIRTSHMGLQAKKKETILQLSYYKNIKKRLIKDSHNNCVKKDPKGAMPFGS